MSALGRFLVTRPTIGPACRMPMLAGGVSRNSIRRTLTLPAGRARLTMMFPSTVRHSGMNMHRLGVSRLLQPAQATSFRSRSFAGGGPWWWKKKRRSKKSQEEPKSPSQGNSQGSKRKRGSKNESRPFEYMTHGPDGRKIMTKKRLAEPAIAAHYSEMNVHTAKNMVNSSITKLRFQLEKSHIAEGPKHEQLFHSTNTLTIPADLRSVLETIPIHANNLYDGSIRLVCTGAARTKKQAEFFAAIDTLMHLSECGIDPVDPPNVAAVLKEQEKERFKSRVQRAQMLLELFNVSRPKFKQKSFDHGRSFVSSVFMYCQGELLSADGAGTSKDEAKANATIAAAETALPDIVGRERLEKFSELIEASPANHVAALFVPRLPMEAHEILEDALGDTNDRLKRVEIYAKAKKAFAAKFQSRRQRNRSSHQKRQGETQDPDTVNKVFMEEEESRQRHALENPGGKQAMINAVRDALPIKAIREELVQALRTEQVVVVSGGTGSGKSTQCPQYILDDAVGNGKGAETRIVVTQPRRIAAISVAERIADERNEKIGNSVGYTVRFNRRAPREVGGSIEFVTTGLLLRRLVNDPDLDGVSHVVCDEVHERDIDMDFLLVLLRDLVIRNPELRVILMSATLDADSFASYFSRRRDAGDRLVPLMSVPAKPRHPVEIIHLEDMAGESPEGYENTGFPSDLQELAQSLLDFQDQQLQCELEEADAEEAAAAKLQERSLAEDEGAIPSDSDLESDSDDEKEGTVLKPWSRAETLRRAVSARTAASGNSVVASNSRQDNREAGEVTTALVAGLAQHIARIETEAGRTGSVLCFLPGWDEIFQSMQALEQCDLAMEGKMIVLPLHSTIPQDEQHRVFTPAENGTLKVILATNIAESSVTIDDVLVVVDSGLVRELNYDPESVMSMMETVPISRASSTQRLGRAGRVAPGKCYRLYSRGSLEAMFERPTPEIQRTALEATCLQTCSMTSKGVASFLQLAMDPPKEEAVSSAMDRLVSLGAINVDPTSGKEVLSPLGHFLSHLPLDPATGRMLLMGCVMQCLDPVLTAAACFSSREVFFTPMGLREEQRAVRRSICDVSDLMAGIRAYDEFQRLIQDEGWSAAVQWASDNFVSIAAVKNIRAVRSQLLNELSRMGLVHKRDLIGNRRKMARLRRDAAINQNAGLEFLHVALWATGLPDGLAARRQLGSFGTLRTRTEDHAGLHPSSVSFYRKPPRGIKLPAWFFFREKILTSQVFLRGCTAVKPEQIVLFGGYLLKESQWLSAVEDGPDKAMKVLDDWIVLESWCDDTVGFLCDARKEIQEALDFKVMAPRRPLPPTSQAILDAVCDVYEILEEREGEHTDDEMLDLY